MTKQMWLSLRSKDEWGIDVYFEFYKEKGGVLSDIFEFEKLFIQMCRVSRQILVTYPDGSTKEREVSGSTALRNVIRYYNEKFSV